MCQQVEFVPVADWERDNQKRIEAAKRLAEFEDRIRKEALASREDFKEWSQVTVS